MRMSEEMRVYDVCGCSKGFETLDGYMCGDAEEMRVFVCRC